MSEELRKQTAGTTPQPTGAPVAGDGAGSTGVEGVAATPDANATAGATKVNLTDFEEFHKWQSKADRRYAEAERRAQESAKRADALERQMAETQRMADEVRLQHADPSEQAAYYRDRLAKERAESQRYKEAEEQVKAFQGRATEFLESVGISPDTPGLDWGGGPSSDGLLTLMESATRMIANRAQTLEQTRQAELAKATRQAELATLEQTGATQVGMSIGGTHTDLRAAYNAEKAKLAGTGDSRGYVNLNRRYRDLGLDV